MADMPNPHRAHPGAYVQDHTPAQFGCTICHRGQGQAVVFAEAKGAGYFWDYPLLPPELTPSSCGVCHTPSEISTQGGDMLGLGEQLFHEKGCQGCHQLNGRGGNLGPALDNEGLKVPHQLPMAHVEGPHTLPQWLIEHFNDPQVVVTGSQMRNPGLSFEETMALTAYMLSLQQRDLPRSYISPAFHATLAEQTQPSDLTGEQLYGRFCATCHADGRFGRYDKFYKKFMPAIGNAPFLAVADSEFIVSAIRNGRPGTLMPAWDAGSGGLSDGEISRIINYLRTEYSEDELALPSLPTNIDLDSGDWQRGADQYRRLCIGCHGPAGAGRVAPAIANSEFQKSAQAGFVFRTIAFGRRNTAMPAFRGEENGGLSDEDILDLVGYVRSLSHTSAKSVASAGTTVHSEHKP
jgi:cytochrome c oxidase cbb3-type subunit 3